jgi:5-methylcytosine-specific restriction protein B
MEPSREVLEAWLGDNDVDDSQVVLDFFDLVQKGVDSPDFVPGHSYWMTKDSSAESLDRIWRYELRPYLQEFWFEHAGRIAGLESEVATALGKAL